jgi:hypothetical protein
MSNLNIDYHGALATYPLISSELYRALPGNTATLKISELQQMMKFPKFLSLQLSNIKKLSKHYP